MHQISYSSDYESIEKRNSTSFTQSLGLQNDKHIWLFDLNEMLLLVNNLNYQRLADDFNNL